MLWIIGLLGTFLLQSRNLTASLKENIQLQLELKDNLTENDILQYQSLLMSEPFVKEVKYVSKDEAAVMMQKELGENFMETLGFNPLYSSLNVNLNADYANADSIAIVTEKLMQGNNAKDIIYDSALVDAIDTNAKKIALIIGVLSVILLIVAIILIDSTIKLAMFSNRFLIRSMQLVGATRWFITKPFILRGIFNGFVSGVLASIILIWMIYYLEQNILDLSIFKNWQDFAFVIGGILLLGMFISWISTHRAVSKYLRMKLDNLY